NTVLLKVRSGKRVIDRNAVIQLMIQIQLTAYPVQSRTNGLSFLLKIIGRGVEGRLFISAAGRQVIFLLYRIIVGYHIVPVGIGFTVPATWSKYLSSTRILI